MIRSFLTALLVPLAIIACRISLDGPSVAGSGVTISQTRSVPAFDRIAIGGAYDVAVRVGATRSVVLEGDDTCSRSSAPKCGTGRFTSRATKTSSLGMRTSGSRSGSRP